MMMTSKICHMHHYYTYAPSFTVCACTMRMYRYYYDKSRAGGMLIEVRWNLGGGIRFGAGEWGTGRGGGGRGGSSGSYLIITLFPHVCLSPYRIPPYRTYLSEMCVRRF